MPLSEVDAVVVGSGAGGAPMALQLARAGLKVVLLEKGPRYSEADFTHDEIAISRRNFFMPLPWDEPHLWRVGQTGKYSRTNHAWTANCVGGGTVHMSGFFYRLKPVDFRMKSMLGAPAGSTVVDWPIGYQDLVGYYEQVEEEIGVSGVVSAHPWAEPRRKPYPLPPLAEHPIAREIDRAGKKIGVHPYPTARAINSRPYRGRAGCIYCTFCGSYGCEVGAKSSTHSALVPLALATGKVELRTRCMARSVEVGPDGRARSVVYLDEGGVLQEQPAKIVVVSCTAVESARLLLNSRSARWPKGLANDSGLVGKNLTFSGFGRSRASFRISKRKQSWPWLDDPAPFVQRSLSDHYVLPASAKLGSRKGGAIGFLWEHPAPISQGIVLAQGGKGAFGKELKERFRVFRDSKVLQFETYAEWLPTAGTQVTVEDSVLDRFGLPVAAITIDRHPADLPVTRYLIDRGEELLRAMEPDAVWRVTEAGETTILQHGTCRFGNDPATSVLDRDCRAHTVPNLYVVDGSFMPTSGGNPNTLTIMANAYRVADRLVQRVKSGKI
ncbi:MAG TPA: GMC family oxidoreductase [Myxococcaceae bacterium]|nr:GMC family oxidoreductase [Myxococcaceae bacterium]